MWARVSGSIRDCCASHLVRARGSLAGEGLEGRVVRDLRRISGFRDRLLPLDGQLHLFGLRRRDYVAFLEIAGAVGNGEWNAPVRGFDRDDFCGHSTVNSGQICGSEGVTAEQEIQENILS